MFDHGDDTLIEELIKSGESLESIADKWDLRDEETGNLNVDILRTYCKRKGITIPKKKPAKPRGNDMRQAVERGEHKSPTVNEIVRLTKAKVKPEKIAASLGKTQRYVERIIDVFCKGDNKARHRNRYYAVNQFSKEFRVPLKDAARMLGTNYSAYQYSARALGLQKDNKKAPA